MVICGVTYDEHVSGVALSPEPCAFAHGELSFVCPSTCEEEVSAGEEEVGGEESFRTSRLMVRSSNDTSWYISQLALLIKNKLFRHKNLFSRNGLEKKPIFFSRKIFGAASGSPCDGRKFGENLRRRVLAEILGSNDN